MYDKNILKQLNITEIRIIEFLLEREENGKVKGLTLNDIAEVMGSRYSQAANKVIKNLEKKKYLLPPEKDGRKNIYILNHDKLEAFKTQPEPTKINANNTSCCCCSCKCQVNRKSA